MTQSPEHLAVRVADAVDKAWHATFSGDPIDVPVAVVAGLALAYTAGPRQYKPLVAAVTAADNAEVGALLFDTWGRMWVDRPDLVARTAPLWAWLRDDPTPDQLHNARLIAAAALRAGLPMLVEHPEARRGVDLLGILLTTLRSKSARASRGQFYTPAGLAEAMAELMAPEPGASFLEPASGTGGMMRAVAQAMRRRGHDPADATWYAVDLDETAVACLAVNVVLWDLGRNVVLGFGDALAGDEWMVRAERERAAAIARMEVAKVLGLAHLAVALVARDRQPRAAGSEGQAA